MERIRIYGTEVYDFEKKMINDQPMPKRVQMVEESVTFHETCESIASLHEQKKRTETLLRMAIRRRDNLLNKISRSLPRDIEFMLDVANENAIPYKQGLIFFLAYGLTTNMFFPATGQKHLWINAESGQEAIVKGLQTVIPHVKPIDGWKIIGYRTHEYDGLFHLVTANDTDWFIMTIRRSRKTVSETPMTLESIVELALGEIKQENNRLADWEED